MSQQRPQSNNFDFIGSIDHTIRFVPLSLKRNFNIAIGNIVGSNLFNLLILCIADVLCFSQSVYDYSDAKVVGLLEFGLFATIAALPMLYSRKKWVKAATAVAAVACYIAFLLR